MHVKIILEWSYSPGDYFEESLTFDEAEFSLEITDGKAVAMISAEIYDEDESIRDTIHGQLEDLFLGVQVINHAPFSLSRYSMYRQHPNGRKDVTIFPESAVLKIRGGKLDIKVTDAHGHVTVDTRADRILAKRRLGELSRKFRRNDPTAGEILNSYAASVSDSENELVHLYEIRDALAKRFGRAKEARSELGISSNRWDRLGVLANVLPLLEGRHRGKSISKLRKATNQELTEARDISRLLICSYLEYLDRH